MDGMFVILLVMAMFFLGLGFINLYKYLVYKQQLRRDLKDQTVKRNIMKKRMSRRERLLSQMFEYADDFSHIGKRINFYSEDHDVKKWLMKAGYPYKLTVDRFQGLKILFMIIGLIFAGIGLLLGLPFSEIGVVLYPLISYAIVIVWMKNKAKKRQEELSFQLPDFLDTMSVTLQAGVNLNQALRDIVPYFEGPIQEEFGRFLQEVSVGVPRHEAYRTLQSRNDSKEFQILIKSLIQGERLGVPISQTFHQQAEEMRKIKKELIKEKAAKASPKVTLITTFIVLPSSLVLIGGLMIINMFSQNRNIFQLFLN
ncbi:type II secretion system F family protein [Alkalibacillus silvisoli]|uniref:Type II secretion system protein GspF domain-containing protein n=1 Tax=Alkalibacillus silvisoli TaxID=392823 RepID=A0ABP3JW53_9BACI